MTPLEEAQVRLLTEQALSLKREDARKSLVTLRETTRIMNNQVQAYKDVYTAITKISQFLSE